MIKGLFSLLPLLFVILSNAQSDNVFNKDSIISDNLKFQKEMNDYFLNPDKSSLPLFLIDEFTEAPYFPIDVDYVVRAKFEESEDGPIIKMKTSTERIAEYKLYGKAHFQLDGEALSLNLYKSKEEKGVEEHWFLPFKDLTNEKESYAAGRYLEVESPEEGYLVIDFNKSYNPSCAYSNRYSCPRVPIDNHLNVAVKAGAQYTKHQEGWNELDTLPQYDGDLGADLMKDLKYPKKARKKKIEGVVYVKMIVNKDGSVSDCKVVKGIHPECDLEALNAARSLGVFKAGIKNGEPVRSHVVLPIHFKLN